MWLLWVSVICAETSFQEVSEQNHYLMLSASDTQDWWPHGRELIVYLFNPSLFCNFVLVGDFNVDFCNSSHILYQKLLTILSSFSLTQVVPSPTHTTSCTGKSTLIDLALVSSPAAVDCSVIPPIGSSDHLGIQLIIRNQRSAKCTGPPRLMWRYTAADWDRACELLNSIDWNEIFSGDINYKSCMDTLGA